MTVLGAVLFYWTSTATRVENYWGVPRTVPAFDTSVSALTLGVLIAGIILTSYSLLSKAPERKVSSLVLIVPIGVAGALFTILIGWGMQHLTGPDNIAASGIAVMLGGASMLVICVASAFERRYRLFVGAVLVIASIIPALYIPISFATLGPLLGIISGVLIIAVSYRSYLATKEERTGESAHQ